MHRRILAVDDSAVIRKLVRVHLNGLGCVVDEAGNGAEALKALPQKNYDVIVLDLMMPVMDGMVFLRMKDALHNTTPVILLTAEVNETLAQGMENACVMAYVKKPLDANALRVAVEDVLTASKVD
jgi:two-component system, sensor histidine kinase SagS